MRALLPLLTAAATLLAGSAAAREAQGSCQLEEFDGFSLASGAVQALGVSALDANSVILGQGPGLVAPGCEYLAGAGGDLHWSAAGYLGVPTAGLYADAAMGELELQYSPPVAEVELRLFAFLGMPDLATVDAFDGNGALLVSLGPVPLQGPGAVVIPLFAQGIERVVVRGGLAMSPVLGQQEYCVGGPRLMLSGNCPGLGFLTVEGMTPNGNIVIGYSFGSGSFALSAGACAGTVIPLASPRILQLVAANSVGQAVVIAPIPGIACGSVTLAAFDLASCGVSNPLPL